MQYVDYLYIERMNKTDNHCIICNNSTKILMNDKILGKHQIDYFFCNNCKCIFTESPYWIEEAYNDSISVTDTGIMLRNFEICNDLFSIIKRYFDNTIKVLDYGGGYGILTRMLRDKGVDTYWSDKYSENLLAKGFEYDGISQMDITLAFEVLEHLPNPFETIKEIMLKTDCFIFSISPLKKLDYTSNTEWWYFSPETGQHIFFPSKQTLHWIAKQIHCNYYNVLGLHIISRKKKFLKLKRFDLFLRKYIRIANRRFLNNKKFVSKTWDDNLYMKNRLNAEFQNGKL